MRDQIAAILLFVLIVGPLAIAVEKLLWALVNFLHV